MDKNQILELMRADAESFSLSARNAVEALAELLSDQNVFLSPDDKAALIAIGSVLYKVAEIDDKCDEYDSFCYQNPMLLT